MKIHPGTGLSHVLAKDLMRKDVLTLAPDDSIDSALQMFQEQHIGGAPVVDSGGNLIGVLTLSDIARPEHLEHDQIQTHGGTFELAEEESEEADEDIDPEAVYFSKENYSSEVLGRERVADWMANEVISVRPGASLVEICELLLDRGIHRVFVTEGKRLLGVVSSTDVVRCVARDLRSRRRG